MKLGIETRAVPGGGCEIRITDPKTGGQKGQKPERFDLFPFDALEEVARVYGVGAQKYADDNWLKGYRWRLSAGALLRHVSAFMRGVDRDEETGCLHLAHAAWHCLTLLTFYMRGLGTDDRAPPKPSRPDPAPDTDAWLDAPLTPEEKKAVESRRVEDAVSWEDSVDIDVPVPYTPTPAAAKPKVETSSEAFWERLSTERGWR